VLTYLLGSDPELERIYQELAHSNSRTHRTPLVEQPRHRATKRSIRYMILEGDELDQRHVRTQKRSQPSMEEDPFFASSSSSSSDFLLEPIIIQAY